MVGSDDEGLQMKRQGVYKSLLTTKKKGRMKKNVDIKQVN